jgi:hypothetical protein
MSPAWGCRGRSAGSDVASLQRPPPPRTATTT